MRGWIAISRDLFAHEFFPKEPMSEREAWVWMIARAAWKDTRHRVGADMIDVCRGSFFCTLRELQGIWGWGSDTRVRTFLKRLQNERMINAASNAGKTHVTICNYGSFQAIERTENASETQNKRNENALKEQGNKEQEKKEPIGSLFDASQAQLPIEPKPASKAPKKARRSISPDWVPSDRNVAEAVARKFTEQEINHEAHKFRDHHLARGTLFADWDAGWRTWLGNARQFATPPRVVGFPQAGGRGQGSSIASIVARRRAGRDE
jgi:ribosomal protein L12E/L44/L45/RPP1/RPP2